MDDVAAIVLVGGLGTRLRPSVGDVPKPLAPVEARPFLHYLLDFLVLHGIKTVMLLTGYKRESFHALAAGYAGANIVLCEEDEPLGTGGAIKHGLERMPPGPVIVLNGDSLFAIDLRELRASHEKSGAKITLSLARVAQADRYGGVQLDATGRVTQFRAASSARDAWINAGIYYANRDDLLSLLPPERRFSFEERVLEPAVRSGVVHGFTSDAYFIDIGTPASYGQAQAEIPGVLASLEKRIRSGQARR